MRLICLICRPLLYEVAEDVQCLTDLIFGHYAVKVHFAGSFEEREIDVSA